jgi:hypothetical protein
LVRGGTQPFGRSAGPDCESDVHAGNFVWISVDSEVNEFTEFVITLLRQMFANLKGRA